MNKGENKKVLLAHGGGGRLTNELIAETIVPKFSNDILSKLTDSADLDLSSASICFTTDSYVIKPLFFNGGDIGKLAVCGTINDIAVCGAKPVALSLSLIIEEGLELNTLEKVLASAADAARDADVSIVTGDTKVVETGAADGLFINTAGLGTKIPGADLSFQRVAPGDKVIVSGTIGDHGMTIISQREGIKFDSPLQSDCASLADLISKLMKNPIPVKFMRDPTRGGLAATFNEIASTAGCDIELNENDIPIDPTVQAAADMLGFDLLNIANEGKVIIVVEEDSANDVLKTCHSHSLGKDAAIIGTVRKAQGTPVVELITKIGGKRIVQTPYGRELPRIC